MAIKTKLTKRIFDFVANSTATIREVFEAQPAKRFTSGRRKSNKNLLGRDVSECCLDDLLCDLGSNEIEHSCSTCGRSRIGPRGAILNEGSRLTVVIRVPNSGAHCGHSRRHDVVIHRRFNPPVTFCYFVFAANSAVTFKRSNVAVGIAPSSRPFNGRPGIRKTPRSQISAP